MLVPSEDGVLPPAVTLITLPTVPASTVPPHAGHGAGNGAANGSGGRRVSINAPPPAAVKNKAEGNQIQARVGGGRGLVFRFVSAFLLQFLL